MEQYLEDFIQVHYPYPSIIDAPETPYVYFNTLQQTEVGTYIYNQVKPYFQQNLNIDMHGNLSGQDKIQAALTFLKHTIDTEYAKERLFIDHLRKTMGKDIELPFEIPSSNEDWGAFIFAFQNAINQSNTGIKSLENELSRLKNNQTRRLESVKSTGKDIVSAQQDQIAYMSDILERMERFMNTWSNNNKYSPIANTIQSMILQKYGQDLLEIDSQGNPKLNQGQLFALIQAITTLVMRDYTIINFNNESRAFDAKQFEEVINTDSINEQITSLIDRAKTIPFITEDLMNAFKITDNNKNNKQISIEYNDILNLLHTSNELNQDMTILTNKFQNMFKNHEVISQDAFKMVKVANAYAEIASLVNFTLEKGSLYGANTGTKGAKPDNLLAILNIDLSKLDWTDNTTITEINKIRNALKILTKSLSSRNTEKYYQEQQANWNEAEKQINKSIKKLQSKYHDLDNLFIIEDSTKNYLQLEAGSKYDKDSNAFHGGSLGANITDQINKITNLAMDGQISIINAKWLITAILNAGPNMIAGEQKNLIEQYLSTFATILLFDDQLNIAAEAINHMKENTPTSSVKKLHVFSLNNGYYPLSYVLQLTYNSLQKGYQNITSYANMSTGAQVIINGFIKNPGEIEDHNKSQHTWASTGQQALNQTKISIHFMIHFLSILDSLFPN